MRNCPGGTASLREGVNLWFVRFLTILTLLSFDCDSLISDQLFIDKRIKNYFDDIRSIRQWANIKAFRCWKELAVKLIV